MVLRTFEVDSGGPSSDTRSDNDSRSRRRSLLTVVFLIVGATTFILAYLGQGFLTHRTSMPQVIPLTGGDQVFVASSADPAGYSSIVTFWLKDSRAMEEYLDIFKPLADYVAEDEPTTLTYRAFVSREMMAVRLLCRFRTFSDFRDIHELSPEHKRYMAAVAAWNASTGAIVRKAKDRWDEIDHGVLFRDYETGKVAGYSQSFTYFCRDKAAADEYLAILIPLSEAIVADEPGCLSYRPFVNEDGSAVRVVGRFKDWSSYKDIHTTTLAHDIYISAVTSWITTGGLVDKEKGAWNETDMGVFMRAAVF